MRAFPVRTKPFLTAVLITALYFVVFVVVCAFAINPGVGEGAGIDPGSFRYRAGVFLDGRVVPVLAVPFLPGILFRELVHLRAGAWDYVIMPISLCLLLWLIFHCLRSAFPLRPRHRSTGWQRH